MKLPSISLPAVRIRAVFLVPAVLLLASLPVNAQGFQGVEPGQSFDIDIKSGKILDPLPFDVHFYLTDTVGDAVESVEGRALGFKEARDCDQALARIPSCPAAGVVDCHPEQTATAKGDPGKRSFEMLMTPLQPNRYYCFQFTTLSDITDPAEKARVEAAVDAAVASVMNQNVWLNPANVQPVVALDQLRASLLAAAQASVGPGKTLRAEPGSFFDTSIPVTQFDAAVGDQVSTFLSFQVGLRDARTNLQSRALAASGALTSLTTSPLWQITAAALQANANQGRIPQLLAGRQDALGLIGLSRSEAVARSEGHTGSLDQIWDAGQIDLATVRKQLGDLQAIAAALRTDEDLRNAAGLDETALAALVAQGCGSTIPANDPVCSANPVTPVFFQTIQGLAGNAAAAFNDNLQASADNLKDFLANRSAKLQELAAKLRALVLETLNLRASTVADYQTRATWYVGADLGAALAWDLEEAFTYAGANIYFRPVNKKAHLSWDDWRKGQRWTEFRKRFSIMLGVPRDEIDVENSEPLIQSRPGLLGAGLRLSDFLRFTFAGALVFKEKDPNPLVDNERLAWSPFVGLSIDWNIAGTFKTMFASVFNVNPQQEAKEDK